MILTDEAVISALMENASITSAAKALGVSRSTISKKLKDSNFQKLWQDVRQAALDATTAMLQCATGEAVSIARSTLADNIVSPQIRLNAATLILSNALKYTEQGEILRRLDALERAQSNEQ